MKSQTLFSYAFLKVNLEYSKKRDYIENFIPIVAECIRVSSCVNDSKVVIAADIQSELSNRFGLSVPLKAIDTLLYRAKRAGYLIRNHAGVYEPVLEELEKLRFKDVQQQVILMHESVIGSLIDFAEERFSISWSVADAEDALHSFLDDTQIILSQEFLRGLKPDTHSQPEIKKYIMGQFVLNLHDTHSGNLEFFETVVKGSMLASAIYLPEPHPRRKFQHTYIYFDTTFLIYALGYSGKPRQDPCIELITMLYNVGAQAYCFEHTVDEIRDALYACASIIDEHRTPMGPSVETVHHFISMGYTGTDIRIKAEKLETELARIRVQVKRKPDYLPAEHKFVPAEADLAKLLSERVFGANADKEAIDRDVASISAIIRLRKGHDTIHIEECKAAFVTTNFRFAKEVRVFFKADNGEASHAPSVPPCISDDELAALLWLKSSVNAPTLPRKRLIADAYAAVQPNERLWQAYVREVERLQAQGDLDADDADLLRYTSTAKSVLMDTTFGNEEAFTQATVPQVLERIRRQDEEDAAKEIAAIAARARAESEALAKAGQAAEMRVAQLEQEKQERLDRMKNRASRLTERMFLIGKIGLLIVLFIAVGAQTLADASDVMTFVREHRLPSLSANCILLSALLLLFLITVISLAKQVLSHDEPSSIQRWISQRIFGFFLYLAEMPDDAQAAEFTKTE